MKRQLAKKLWLGGALSGGATGAIGGSTFGPWGTVAGSIVGFIGGGISADKSKKRLRDETIQRDKMRRDYSLMQQSLAERQQEESEQFRLDQEDRTRRFQFAHDQLIEEQQEQIRLESDKTYFRDYAGGKGRGFGIKSFYQKGGNMKLAKPDVLGVRQDPSKGGYIDNTASNAGIVKGRSHETGGVQLPQAEVEGGESVVQSPFTGETQVHSDSLGISQHTNELIERKGELEQKLQRTQDKIDVVEFDLNTESTTIRRNSYKRQLDALIAEMEQYQNKISEIDAQVEQLYQAQEGMKSTEGDQIGQGSPIDTDIGNKRIMQTGGKYSLEKMQPKGFNTIHDDRTNIGLASMDSIGGSGKFSTSSFDWKNAAGKVGAAVQLATPFIDNIYNAHLTSKLRGMDVPTPPIMKPTLYGDPVLHDDPVMQKPIMDKATYLDPTHDVSDKLSGIERDTARTTRHVMGDVSDSRVGRALAMDIGLQGTHMKGQVATEKLNQERIGRNLNRQIAQEVSMRNVDRTNQYNMANLQRLDRVGMANTELINAYARGDIDMINQYNLMNLEADYQHRMSQFEKDIQTDVTMPSQNLARMRDEIIGILDRRDMRSFQDKQIALQALVAENEGTFRRNIMPLLNEEQQKRVMEILGETK